MINLRSRTRARTVACLLSCLSYLLISPAFAQSPIRVETTIAEQQDLVNEVPLTGSVSSSRIALLSTQVAGLIAELHVDAGDRVAQGDLLLELDRELSEIAVDSAEASAASAREALADSRRLLEEAEKLETQSNIAASEVRSREAQVRIDEAALRAAQAEVQRREAELARHRIIAPFDGTISRKLAEVGEWLSPGTDIVELVGTETLHMDFQVPQRFYADIDQAARLSIQFDAHPEQVFSARVHRKVPLSRDNARTFLLRTVLENGAAPLLIPGMSADASLQLALGRQGVAVPRDALFRHPDGRVSVWVITDHNAESGRANVREQLVEAGLSFAGLVEIRSGLEAGQEVITRGNETLREGQIVQIVPSDSE